MKRCKSTYLAPEAALPPPSIASRPPRRLQTGQSLLLFTPIDDTKKSYYNFKKLVFEFGTGFARAFREREGLVWRGRASGAYVLSPRPDDVLVGVCAKSTAIHASGRRDTAFTCSAAPRPRGKRFSRGKRDSDRPRCLEPRPLNNCPRVGRHCLAPRVGG